MSGFSPRAVPEHPAPRLGSHPPLGATPVGPTSRRDTSISTAKLVIWLHWQLTWLSLRKTTSQPRADQPPVPLTLWEEDGVREEERGWGTARRVDSWSKVMGIRVAQAHRIEWFQKTQMGLVLSSVSSSRNCTVTGLSRARGRSSSPSWTLMLTTGVLMTGRLGTLMTERYTVTKAATRHPYHREMFPIRLLTPTSQALSWPLTSGSAYQGHSCGAAVQPGYGR